MVSLDSNRMLRQQSLKYIIGLWLFIIFVKPFLERDMDFAIFIP